MDICYILLRIIWQYDRKGIHDGRRNTNKLDKNGHKHVLLPLQDEGTKEEVGPIVLLMSGKDLLQEVKKEEEAHLSLIGNPKVILTSTSLHDFPGEIKLCWINY